MIIYKLLLLALICYGVTCSITHCSANSNCITGVYNSSGSGTSDCDQDPECWQCNLGYLRTDETSPVQDTCEPCVHTKAFGLNEQSCINYDVCSEDERKIYNAGTDSTPTYICSAKNPTTDKWYVDYEQNVSISQTLCQSRTGTNDRKYIYEFNNTYYCVNQTTCDKTLSGYFSGQTCIRIKNCTTINTQNHNRCDTCDPGYQRISFSSPAYDVCQACSISQILNTETNTCFPLGTCPQKSKFFNSGNNAYPIYFCSKTIPSTITWYLDFTSKMYVSESTCNDRSSGNNLIFKNNTGNYCVSSAYCGTSKVMGYPWYSKCQVIENCRVINVTDYKVCNTCHTGYTLVETSGYPDTCVSYGSIIFAMFQIWIAALVGFVAIVVM